MCAYAPWSGWAAPLAFSSLDVLGDPAASRLARRKSPDGIEVVQLTTEPDVPASHLYMEAQIFTPDSKRFVLHRSATAHGSSKNDPKHQYLLCDHRRRLLAASADRGDWAPRRASVSPDGKYLYYFVDETKPGGGRLTLKRVNLDGTDRQTILVVDTPLPDTKFRPSRIYPLSTISSDGKRLALSAFLGDGQTDGRSLRPDGLRPGSRPRSSW